MSAWNRDNTYQNEQNTKGEKEEEGGGWVIRKNNVATARPKIVKDTTCTDADIEAIWRIN
jgi:hypothetical protein